MTIRRSLAWAFSGQIVNLAVSLVGSVIIARLLSPREMGSYAVATATVGVLGIVTSLGIGAYIVREREVSEEKLASAFTVNALISVCLSLIVFSLSFVGGKWMHEPAVADVLRLLAVPPLIGIFEFRPAALLQRHMQFGVLTVMGVVSNVLTVGLTALLALAGLSSLSMAYSTILAALVRVAGYALVMPDGLRCRLSLSNWRPILSFGLSMVTVGGVAGFAQRASEIILGGLLGLAMLGLYSRASSLASLVFNNLYGTATGIVFSQLSKTYRETGVLRDTFLRGLQIIIALMWPLMVGLAVLARPAIYIVYGPKWTEAALPLSLLLIGQVLVLSFGMNWELFVLRNETSRQARYEIIRSAAGLACFAVGALFSIGAAALGRTADALVGALLYLPQMSRLANTSRGDLLAIYLQGMALTAAAVLPSLIVMVVNQWRFDVPPPTIVLGVAAGLVLWAVALKLLDHPLLQEVDVLRRRYRRLVGPAPRS